MYLLGDVCVHDRATAHLDFYRVHQHLSSQDLHLRGHKRLLSN